MYNIYIYCNNKIKKRFDWRLTNTVIKNLYSLVAISYECLFSLAFAGASYIKILTYYDITIKALYTIELLGL